jgi:hypothetical protein
MEKMVPEIVTLDRACENCSGSFWISYPGQKFCCRSCKEQKAKEDMREAKALLRQLRAQQAEGGAA